MCGAHTQTGKVVIDLLLETQTGLEDGMPARRRPRGSSATTSDEPPSGTW